MATRSTNKMRVFEPFNQRNIVKLFSSTTDIEQMIAKKVSIVR